DAIPADLPLLVTTANESPPPVPQPPPDVAGPIQPLAGPVGVGHHVLGRERWTVAVATHQARAPDEDLPFDSLGHELQVPVEDVYVHAVDGLADRRQGRFTSLTHGIAGRHDRRFRRTVVVDERVAPSRVGPAAKSIAPGEDRSQ